MATKIHVKTFPKESKTKTSDLLEVVHTDICGPFSVNSLGGARYFITFIDDFSRRIFVYFLKTKGEALQKFRLYKQHVEKQTGRRIKILRSDNGREYINNDFDNFLKGEGITRQLTVPYTPQQNGVAERANRTLVEMARSMMVHSQVSQDLWAEAINTAAYIRNRCPTKKIGNKTPYEVWFGRSPNIQHLRIFGSYAVALNKGNRVGSKFKAKGESYILVGYSNEAKAYRLYDKNNRSIVERRDVIFQENDFAHNKTDKKLLEVTEDYLQFIIEEQKPPDTPDVLERQISAGIEPQQVKSDDDDDDFLGFESAEENNEKAEVDIQNKIEATSPKLDDSPKTKRKRGRPRKQKLNTITNEDIPNTVNEAMSSKNHKKWYEAMKTEISSLKENGTWSLADLPDGAKAIETKWVFAVKKDETGNIERYKARLVAKGCSQRLGIDYTDTFSPVARYATIRLVMSLAVQWRMHLHQIDVKSAYLNSDIKHDIYIRQPKEFIDLKNPNKVLKLHKAIYGLKQSGKEWNDKLDLVISQIGFKQCVNEPCLYKSTIKGQLVLITVYVDDLLIACKDKNIVIAVKNMIGDRFPISDKGQLHHYLGIEVDREGEVGPISICQSQYIKNLLEEYGMRDCKAVATPLEVNHQVNCNEDNCEKIQQHDYQSIIGALMYLAITTRPDILHSVTKLAQRNTNPHIEHMRAIKRIMRYLRGTVDVKISYRPGPASLEGFVDADWGGDTTDRKSYTAFVFFVGGCPISWQSRKQTCVALSSTEAEYVAMSEAAKEAIFLK